MSDMRIEELDDSTRLQVLIDSVTDYAIYTIDLDGNVVSWNVGAERLKGFTAKEIIGRPFRTFFTTEDQTQGLPERALATAAKEGRFESEGWRVRKDGTKFWALAVLDPIRDDTGDVIGFVKVTRDMTERRQAQLHLQEIQEQLAISQKMEAVGQLSGGIAHDFNNLLMIVLGNLETAERVARELTGPNLPRLQRALSNSVRGAQRAAALTQRLLAFSRRQPLDPKPLDVNRFITGIVDFIRRSLGERIEVEVVGAGGLWLVEVDHTQLETTIVNLAINARDAMPDGGKLTVEALNTFLDKDYCRGNPEVSPGQYVLICVSDTGHGMTAEVANRAFEPFFTTKDIGKGTGLGLSQVYGFVKQSKGHVKIYSEPGEGTTVKIYLPRLIGDGEGESETDRGEELTTAEGSETILIVEDDYLLRSYMVEILRELGYRVLASADALQALAFIEQPNVRIDLMLTDIVMSGMNGRELADRARRMRPALKILFMTGYSRNAVMHQGRVDPDVNLVQKPISQRELSLRIRDAIERCD
jgi:PAS domain S-box-containing protein